VEIEIGSSSWNTKTQAFWTSMYVSKKPSHGSHAKLWDKWVVGLHVMLIGQFCENAKEFVPQ
jgi:hypothetical protein